ncbi:PH domain-containing protein, partial [Mycobacterium sp.]|uniref:PH domain-containing protein n=1 Tax=Mycobacterium sp. TaxID=1785 RepID=UPI002D621F9E
MLLVHPVHEVLRQLPVLIGSAVLGSATGNQAWPLAALAITVGFGLARWFTTTYRIDTENVVLHTGVLQRRLISLPRNRIRSVQTDARLLHRLLGLTVIRVSTGHEVKGENRFELDAVETAQVAQLRTTLLAESLPAGTAEAAEQQSRVLARWRPSWLRYSPLSFSGLLMIAAAAGVAYQAGLGVALQRSHLAQSGVAVAQRWGVGLVVAAITVSLLVASVLLSVVWSMLTYGNLVLRRDFGPDGGVLHLRHGVLRVREHTYDLSRLRGGTLLEPLPVRAVRGARLDAVMTGVDGEGESSVLLPPCPRDTASAVLTEL